jgi:peptidylprolyl isomerase
MPILLRALCLPLIAVALIVAGCGGEDEPPKLKDQPQPNAPQPPASTPQTPPDLQTKPKVGNPSGPPPKKLEVKDIIQGTGKAAQKGSNVTVNYVGVLFESGKEFDASWERKQPFPFQLGSGMVIPGWDKGLVGMKEGGRRRLTIPPDQAYGSQGSPPTIGPNETLVFVIDMLKVQ